MTACFTRYLLQRSGETNTLRVSEDPVEHPNRQADPADGSAILIGGGFSRRSPEPSYPLSATLQLNGDRGVFSREQLRDIAAAEYERKRLASYRSYTIEPELRLCVIGSDTARLERFEETYGGILELDILHTGPAHPNYPEVSELTVSQEQSGYRLDYEVKAPIALDRCTYCGQCGAVCPERCISETLFLDFSSCTCCKACEPVCPVGAIDISVVEMRTLHTPAIVVLGSPAIDMPAGAEAIFSETEMERYFATLFTARVDEIVSCNRGICQYNIATASGCRQCVDICPSGAVSITADGIAVEAVKCTDCGRCIGRCPTGALQHEKCTDRAFIDYFRMFRLPAGTSVVIGAEQDLHRLWWLLGNRRCENMFFMEFPAAAALSPMHLLCFLAHGVHHLYIISKDDETGPPGLAATVSEINLMAGRIGGTGEFVSLVSPEELAVMEQAASATPPASPDEKHYGESNRRRLYAAMLEGLVAAAPYDVSFGEGEVRDLGTITCDPDRCTHCLACLTGCKIESLSWSEADMILGWNGSRCVGCRACVTICPEDALCFRAEATLTDDYFRTQPLARAEPIRCRACGKIFGNKKSYERVMQILSKRDQSGVAYLDHCQDCRVIKLMESE